MLELKNICVKYSYKNVLNGISIDFQKGRIYAFLGENGAGKSTLAHVICGDLQPTSGQIFIDNKEVSFKSPHDAIRMGISCIHQTPLLSRELTVLQNITLGFSGKKIRQFLRENTIENLCKIFLPDTDLKTKVQNISQTECFFVSLINSLLSNPRVLILDEPPEIPVEKLRLLSQQGITLIIITHDLTEAIIKSHKIVLLKEGLILQECNSTEITEQEIQSKLFGISKKVELPQEFITKKIQESEIKHIFGKTGYIPSDKNYTASDPELTILELLTAFNPKGSQSQLEKSAANLLQKAEVNIKLNEKVSSLSGGMLQKLILEREISQKPEELYLFKPTQGLDVEATERTYSKLKQLGACGTKIIIGETE